MVSFQDFDIPEPILKALANMGFETPSDIQARMIPVAMAGRDALGQAQTGTGKTAAFAVPLVARAMDGDLAIVLVPTRELAKQVQGEIDRVGEVAGVRALAVYGGTPINAQMREIERGETSILVATPGRFIDLMKRGAIKPAAADVVVLDEADEMLTMGFIEDVELILDAIGPDRQTMLFSATLPEPIVRLAETHLTNPEYVMCATDSGSVANDATHQFAVAVEHRAKVDAFIRLMAVERPTGVIVFRHTRDSVDELVRDLRQKGVAAEALHGGMAQNSREEVLARFRRTATRVLVATNVAARGLDVDAVSHVVNFDCPRETDAYVHRIGRTGRAGREGRSFLFVTPRDRGSLRAIEHTVGERLPWFEVPTDEQVHDAVAKHTAEWLAQESLNVSDRHLEIVDAAIAAGGDLRTLAASLLSRVSKMEGLDAPPLESFNSPRYARRGDMQPKPNGKRLDPRDAQPIMINAGHLQNIRPADVVGALANETGIAGSDVGRIDILPQMTVAEVPRDQAHTIADTMNGVIIRGHRVMAKVAENWEFRKGGAPMPQRPRR